MHYNSLRMIGDRMTMVPFSLRLDPTVKARLDDEARSMERSSSWLATKAIESFLEARATKRAAIHDAITEAERGVFISSEAIGEWMDSWGTENELPKPEADIAPEPR